MLEVTVFIPVYDNDGVSFTVAHFAVFEAQILETFGGYRMQPQTVAGAWRNDAGVTFIDECRVYIVAIGSITDGGRLASLVGFAKLHFRQEAIGVSYLGIFEIL
jgi:hypothetical protein